MPFAADPPPSWHPPVSPVVIVRSYREVARFAAGGHRGIDLRAQPGRAVGAPCGGRVSFRGAVAGGPPTVTIDCGELRATLQRLAPTKPLGARVGRGSTIGVATETALDLSARKADGSYLDPAPLLGVDHGGQGPVIGLHRRPGPQAPRPAVTRQLPYQPARIADRALVTPRPAPNREAAAPGAEARVDVPLGLGGGALMAVVVVGWAAAVAKGRRRTINAARGASLARVQR